MSKIRWISTLAAGLGLLAAACWYVTVALPLSAAPQLVTDGAGVTVDTGAATLLHRPSIPYPPAARAKGIQGTVIVEARVDQSGTVVDARVLSGPDELRRGALESTLQWHFTRGTGGGTRQVSIIYQLPAGQSPAPSPTPGMVRSPVPGGEPPWSGKVTSIDVLGLSDQIRDDLMARLPLRIGETVTMEKLMQARNVVREFDEHLLFGITPQKDSVSIRITPPGSGGSGGAPPSPVARPTASSTYPNALKVDPADQRAKIIQQARPEYPALAKQARISGTVKLNAVIGADGTMKHLEVISGHPLLVPAALEAVKQWTYQPTLLNGNPVDVVTQIDVNFSLAE
jgi:TonB family protein